MKAPTWFLKTLHWTAWLSTAIGLFSILCAFLSSVLPKSLWNPDRTSLDNLERYMLGVEHRVNFFIIAGCFFLLTIVLYIHIQQLKKE